MCCIPEHMDACVAEKNHGHCGSVWNLNLEHTVST